MRVREFAEGDRAAWDRWVAASRFGTVFHDIAWRDIIAETMRHRPTYLLAEDDGGICGVLPLFILRTRVFGTMAVSLPFVNYGGVAADSEQAATALLDEARAVAASHGCKYVEFRHRHLPLGASELPTNTFKVTSVLDLSGGAEHVWKTKLHQNVRNKVRKAGKNGVVVHSGPGELGAFYEVFAVGQRNHGTPVLSRRFFEKMIDRLGDAVHVHVARFEGRPIGGKVTVDFGDTRYFIWSASLREANRYAPVAAMNWHAIEDAANAGLQKIDFGRSTEGSSSQSFKKYWGVETEQLYWQYHLLAGDRMPGLNTGNPKFEMAIRIWRRLPVWLSKIVGPLLARLLP